jgi:hypothetical protein
MKKIIFSLFIFVLVPFSFAADYQVYWNAVTTYTDNTPLPPGGIAYDVRIDNVIRAVGVGGTTWDFIDNTYSTTHRVTVRTNVPSLERTSDWAPEVAYTTDPLPKVINPPAALGVRKK